MIRRLLAATTLVTGLLVLGAGPASAATPSVKADAANGNIACVYNLKPLDIGLCIGI